MDILKRTETSLFSSDSPFELKLTDYEGRFVVAKRDLDIGEEFVCKSYFAVATEPFKKSTCHNCLRVIQNISTTTTELNNNQNNNNNNNILKCDNCNEVWWCSEECKNNNKEDHGKFECKFFKRMKVAGLTKEKFDSDTFTEIRMIVGLLSRFIYNLQNPDQQEHQQNNQNNHSIFSQNTLKDVFDLVENNITAENNELANERVNQIVEYTKNLLYDVLIKSKKKKSSNRQNIKKIIESVVPTLVEESTNKSIDTKNDDSTTQQQNQEQNQEQSKELNIYNETIQKIRSLICKVRCNQFGIWSKKDKCLGVAVSPSSSYFNHSCVPNCSHISDGKELTFKILYPVKMGTPICIGSLYSWSIFNKPIDKAIYGDENEGKAPVTFYIAVAVFGVSVAIMGPWLERKGPRLGIFVGASLFVAGLFLTALGIHIKHIWLVYVGYGIFGGSGIGVSYISPVSTLQKWFPDHRGLSAGFAVCGFGAGSIAFGQIPPPIIDSVGLPLTFVILGYGEKIVCNTLSSSEDKELSKKIQQEEPSEQQELELMEIPPTKSEENQVEINIEEEKKEKVPGPTGTLKKNLTFFQAITSREFILIYLMFFANVIFGLVAISRLSNMVQDIFGKSKSTASIIVSINGGFNLAGRLVFAIISDKIGRKIMYILSLTIQAIIVGLLPTLVEESSYTAFIALIWTLTAFYGSGFGLIPALLTDLFGSKLVGSAHGVILTAWSIAGVAGGLIFTAIYDSERDRGYKMDSCSYSNWLVY
eukprot:gene2022-2489_t